MEIRHEMIVRSEPEKLYKALTEKTELEIWMDAQTTARPEIGSMIEFQYGHDKPALKLQITRLEQGYLIQWRVIQSLWSPSTADQLITWTLTSFDKSTLVNFRMEGWTENHDAYASVSYKWAVFMMRLKIYMGDTREIATLLPIIKGAST